MIPDLDARVVSIRTTWPGASPHDVGKEILVEQEKYLGRIPGLERMVSTVNTGKAEIELEFPFSVGIEEALLNVNNALSQVPGYPENVDQPSIKAEAFSSAPINRKLRLRAWSLAECGLKALARHHGSRGVLARSPPIGSMVLWVVALLGLSLLLHYL